MTQPTNVMMRWRFAMAAIMPLAVAVSVADAQVSNGVRRGGATHEVVIKVPGMT